MAAGESGVGVGSKQPDSAAAQVKGGLRVDQVLVGGRPIRPQWREESRMTSLFLARAVGLVHLGVPLHFLSCRGAPTCPPGSQPGLPLETDLHRAVQTRAPLSLPSTSAVSLFGSGSPRIY